MNRWMIAWVGVLPLAFGLACPRAEAAGSVPGTGLVRLTERALAWVAEDERSSNGALFVGRDAALMVDPGLTPEISRSFLSAAREVTDLPLRWIVLTHWHPDHALGAVCLDEPDVDRDVELVCHPRTRRSLAENGARIKANLAAGASGASERRSLEQSRIRLPERLLEQRETFELGDHQVVVFPAGVAHTGGDLVVWSPDEGVLVTGDLVMQGSCPSMGEGSVLTWIEALGDLAELAPRHVVPGHFDPGSAEILLRFRDYLTLLVERARKTLAGEHPAAAPPADFTGTPFASFRQFPRYGATFEQNTRDVLRELAELSPPSGEALGFRSLAVLDVGRNPHQISFSADASRAYVAAAGSDRITVVATEDPRVLEQIDSPGVPLGVVELPDGDLMVSSFGADRVVRLHGQEHAPSDQLVTGAGTSLLFGPLPNGRYLASTESANRMHVLDAGAFQIEHSYETGARPFPPAATADGRQAFVPNYDDGSVTVVDLWNGRLRATVPVGEHPSGGVVIESLHAYAVAVRGEDRIALINTASHQVERVIRRGIGRSPFSVVVTPDESLAFVNDTASHDVAVIDLQSDPEPRVIARIPVGEIPITLAVHPSGRTLWVGCEGSHELHVIGIPSRPRPAPPAPPVSRSTEPAEVLVLGMIHGEHLRSKLWGLSQVRATIRRFDPDVVCCEIPPERFDQAWREWAERGVIKEPRVLRFPEYTEVLLPLKAELGFEIEPCAAWTRELADLRQTRMREFANDPANAAEHAAYQRAEALVKQQLASDPLDADDPRVIHSDRYDRRTRKELEPYDHYLNERIGPGGWTQINRAHYTLIEQALERHPGRRILIMFGAGHKYWILDHLRERQGVRLVDAGKYLPEVN